MPGLAYLSTTAVYAEGWKRQNIVFGETLVPPELECEIGKKGAMIYEYAEDIFQLRTLN
jgi:hypothetical protein